jgi:hypothetical protein
VLAQLPGTSIGGTPLPRHSQSKVATIPADHPGRAASHPGTGRRISNRSAAKHSASINSGVAITNRRETGAPATSSDPSADTTTARATHRQVTTTPAPYQCDAEPSRPRNRSAAVQTTPKSERATLTFSAGT